MDAASPRDHERDDGGVATEVEKKAKQKLQRPKLYKVLLHNDDYTTMEFVVALLIHVFHHDEASAQAIMLHIHTSGVGVAGVYTYEIAETKVATGDGAGREGGVPAAVHDGAGR